MQVARWQLGYLPCLIFATGMQVEQLLETWCSAWASTRYHLKETVKQTNFGTYWLMNTTEFSQPPICHHIKLPIRKPQETLQMIYRTIIHITYFFHYALQWLSLSYATLANFLLWEKNKVLPAKIEIRWSVHVHQHSCMKFVADQEWQLTFHFQFLFLWRIWNRHKNIIPSSLLKRIKTTQKE